MKGFSLIHKSDYVNSKLSLNFHQKGIANNHIQAKHVILKIAVVEIQTQTFEETEALGTCLRLLGCATVLSTVSSRVSH